MPVTPVCFHDQFVSAADGSVCNNTDKNSPHTLGIHHKAIVLLCRKESVLPFCSSYISTLYCPTVVFSAPERHKAKRESGSPAAIAGDARDVRG